MMKVDGKKLIFADGNIVELPEAIAKRIAGYSEVIMGIRGEDIKFDTTNLDVYGSHQKAKLLTIRRLWEMRIICILTLEEA